MSQTARFQETLRKLAMIHESFVQDKARLGLDLARGSALDPKTAALLVVGVAVDARTGHSVSPGFLGQMASACGSGVARRR